MVSFTPTSMNITLTASLVAAFPGMVMTMSTSCFYVHVLGTNGGANTAPFLYTCKDMTYRSPSGLLSSVGYPMRIVMMVQCNTLT